MKRIAIIFFFVAACSFLSCSGPKTKNEPIRDAGQPHEASPQSLPEIRDQRPIIVAFGDSLTAGLGVDPAQNYPSKLQAKLDAAGHRYRVINAGVSGDTSSQGLSRADAICALRPAIAIVELGANDGLRGLPVETTRNNLAAIISRLQAVGAKVILAGMEMPPNYGPAYTSAFRNIFPELAKKHHIALIPFFLDGVGGHSDLNQEDGIHPTGGGYDIVVENAWKVLKPLL